MSHYSDAAGAEPRLRVVVVLILRPSSSAKIPFKEE